MYRRALIALVLAGCLTGPGWAGIFGKKPAKPNPAERVPELLAILKTVGDENKRIEAIDELRYYDPTAFPQMVPALIDVLQNDPKPAVRSEAADVLGKLQPTSQAVGQALEMARDKDPAMRVRMQARFSLLGYHWQGYKGSKPTDPSVPPKEPPLIDPKAEPNPVLRGPMLLPPPRANVPLNAESLHMPSDRSGMPSLKPPANPPPPPAPLPPPPSQPSKFSFFGLRSSQPAARPPEQSKEPPLAQPLPIETQAPPSPQGPELPLPPFVPPAQRLR